MSAAEFFWLICQKTLKSWRSATLPYTAQICSFFREKKQIWKEHYQSYLNIKLNLMWQVGSHISYILNKSPKSQRGNYFCHFEFLYVNAVITEPTSSPTRSAISFFFAASPKSAQLWTNGFLNCTGKSTIAKLLAVVDHQRTLTKYCTGTVHS
jgi:hypothetical protein